MLRLHVQMLSRIPETLLDSVINEIRWNNNYINAASHVTFCSHNQLSRDTGTRTKRESENRFDPVSLLSLEAGEADSSVRHFLFLRQNTIENRHVWVKLTF
ncbi:hypothetical protein AVEN_138171-1 [Araneus ventricosus]|uniref:Uncharacterized protein n=1 Tax=Araneus ventricosus TaxID=182803 RepID=A0A4Y2LZX0_ARAVE|nr:hypothetical protein AVEN_138171-1 [Araneus ventricosus]